MDHVASSFTESRRKPLSLSFLHFRDEDDEAAPAPKGVLLPLSFIGSLKRRHSFGGFVQYVVCEALETPDEHTGNLLEQKMLDGLKDEAAAIATRKQSADPAKVAASAANQRMEFYDTGKGSVPAKVSVQPKCSASPESSSAAPPCLLRTVAAKSPGREEGGELTLMIRNLPRDLDQPTLIEHLYLWGFGGKFNFCWLPFKLGARRGKGYAFVNFAKGRDAERCRMQWAWQQNVFEGRKLSICDAVVQGIEANLKKLDHPNLRRITNPALRPCVADRFLNRSNEETWASSAAGGGS